MYILYVVPLLSGLCLAYVYKYWIEVLVMAIVNNYFLF